MAAHDWWLDPRTAARDIRIVGKGRNTSFPGPTNQQTFALALRRIYTGFSIISGRDIARHSKNGFIAHPSSCRWTGGDRDDKEEKDTNNEYSKNQDYEDLCDLLHNQ